jgi:hypothetical protein
MTENEASASGSSPDDPELRFEDYFREGSAPTEALLWWQLERNEPLLNALRALCHGPAALVRLRVWVFMELMALPEAKLERETLNRHFHMLRDEPLELVLKRLREAELLAWDATEHIYGIKPLALQLVGLLTPLTRARGEDDDLAALLTNVAGAHALGLLDPQHLGHLRAQLARLHDQFADAIASGSEFQLRRARQRFDKAITLVGKANESLTAIVDAAREKGDAKLERLARELGLAQARLLSMASQVTRALQQADRQRVTLGSTGLTSTDVRRWLQSMPYLENLALDALSRPVHPVMVGQHELLDMAEAEFERDRPLAKTIEPLPQGMQAPAGELAVMSLPPEMAQMLALLNGWTAEDRGEQDLAPAVLGGSYARSVYRAQLLPLLGDPQAQHLQGATGDMARQPWRVLWSGEQGEIDDEYVSWMSRGVLRSTTENAAENIKDSDKQ